MNVSTASLLSTTEKSVASEYLVRTKQRLVDAVKDCSGPDWHFKPCAEEWSILGVLEHVVIVERLIHGLVGRLGDAPEAGGRPGGGEPILSPNVGSTENEQHSSGD